MAIKNIKKNQYTNVLKNGESVLIRPIDHADQELWITFVDNCSESSILGRFNSILNRSNLEYDYWFSQILQDEVALVAEVSYRDKVEIVGLVELISGPTSNSCEFTIIVTDDWQRQALGSLLTLYALRFAQSLGVDVIYALTSIDNEAMINLFKKFGFRLEKEIHRKEIYAEKFIGQTVLASS